MRRIEKIGKSVLKQIPKTRKQTSNWKLIEILMRAISLNRGEHFYPFKGKRLPKIYASTNYIHVRLKEPGNYSNFRFHDVGRRGHSLRLAAINKRTGKWETISWIFDKEKLATDRKMQKIFFGILRGK